jgi:DNA-binding NarL/FixJ family response regulator
MSDIRLLIVADDPLARAGLATALAELPGVQVVGQTAGDEGLPTMLPVYRPDVVLWDLGWEALELPEMLGDTPTPVLALLPGEELASDVWAAGVEGLLDRNSRPEALGAALAAIGQGLRVVEPGFAAVLSATERPTALPVEAELTRREQQVLRLLAEGMTNKAIAQELQVSDHTVKFHVNAIMSKLDAQSRTEAVVKATRLGLLLL